MSTDNKIKNFEYAGLFLTEDSKNKLKEWLLVNGIKYDPDFIKEMNKRDYYLDHCTLLHKSQIEDNFNLYTVIHTIFKLYKNKIRTLNINGIGISDKVIAFRVDLDNGCANKIPHITICTFNGGKPVDSNDITNWVDINPIKVYASIDIIYK